MAPLQHWQLCPYQVVNVDVDVDVHIDADAHVNVDVHADADAATADAHAIPQPGDRVYKYWLQRHRLFTRFDEGVRMDEEGWFSATPELIARHHAQRCRGRIVVDAFCGVGGNAIQLARTCEKVIAIDIDAHRLSLARHNARVYGVEEKIVFVHGDFFEVAFTYRDIIDGVFLSPPWGGPEYLTQRHYTLDQILPRHGRDLLTFVLGQLSPNVCLYLPRNVDLQRLLADVHDVEKLVAADVADVHAGDTDNAEEGRMGRLPSFDVEVNLMNERPKTVSLYFGGFRATVAAAANAIDGDDTSEGDDDDGDTSEEDDDTSSSSTSSSSMSYGE